MAFLLVLLVVLLILGAAVGGYVFGVRAGRLVAAESLAERQGAVDAAVDAAVRAVLVERGATAASVAVEREHTVHSAVDTAVKLAGSALDARLDAGTKHLDVRVATFEQRARDISGELKRVSDLVAVLQKERAHQHGEVINRLEQTAKAAATLQHTTQGLRDALASPKTRGQWGERMADDVLRAAGFVEGVNYRQQSTNAAGRRPDFTFLLPKGVELNMDVKFPIDNYLRYLDATTDAERTAACGAFLRDVRNRVKEITGREYIDPSRTVDQVLLFIPNESVYTFIHENDPQLLDKALEQKVVMCSPSTLFAVLAVVRHAMRNFLFEQTSDEILTCLTSFNRQWTKFTDQLEKVEKQFTLATSAFDDLNGVRRRQLQREVDHVETLRSRTKTEVELDGPERPLSPSVPVRALRAG